jgi:hypothetical protein
MSFFRLQNEEDGGARLWESRSDFQEGAVGACCASTAPAASTASVVGAPGALPEPIAAACENR